MMDLPTSTESMGELERRRSMGCWTAVLSMDIFAE